MTIKECIKHYSSIIFSSLFILSFLNAVILSYCRTEIPFTIIGWLVFSVIMLVLLYPGVVKSIRVGETTIQLREGKESILEEHKLPNSETEALLWLNWHKWMEGDYVKALNKMGKVLLPDEYKRQSSRKSKTYINELVRNNKEILVKDLENLVNNFRPDNEKIKSEIELLNEWKSI